MVGMAKEQVLACAGPPANRASEGQTEVWSYSTTPTFTSDRGTGSTRFCTVNVTMSSGRVSAVDYSGATGGLLSAGEQCAYVVEKCAPR